MTHEGSANTLVEYGATIDATGDGDAAGRDGTGTRTGPPRPRTTTSTSRAGRSCSPCAASTGWNGSARRSSTYTPEETRIWREVSPKLDELHLKHACAIYLKAKDDLAITQTEIPQLRTLSERLERETNMHLVPAEGALPYRTFYEYIAAARLPGDAVHPARLAPGVHARTGHDPRLPRPRAAADEPGLRRAAHAHRQGGRDDAARRPGAGAEAVQLVQHRVRADRGGGRDEGVRRRHPVAARARSRTRCSRRT